MRKFSDRAEACPHCGCPNDNAPTPKAQPVDSNSTNKAATGCVSGCLLVIAFIAILGVIGSFVGDGGRNPEPEDNSWVPEGFTKYDDEVAWRWSPRDSYNCRRNRSCLQIEVVPKTGCDSLYAKASLVDSSGNNVGYTNESTSDVSAGQKALLMLDTYRDNFSTFRLAKISCY